MKTVAYLLASSNREEIRAQRQVILEFVHKEQMRISRFIEIPITSLLPTKGRKFNRLLSHVEPGDTLIVSHLSQIGWSLAEIVKTVDRLINREIRFVAVKEGIDLNGKPSVQSEVIVTMFGMLAEIGRDLVSRRTKEALAIAKRKGRIGGRPEALNTPQQKLAVKLYQEDRHSIKEICQIMDISKTTLYSYLKKANSELKNPPKFCL
ncbi:recombinase family protein [Candidatus Poribacteria bacterium]|nr:recombinase family protein [Candidatus Poribacteria bacterium]